MGGSVRGRLSADPLGKGKFSSVEGGGNTDRGKNRNNEDRDGRRTGGALDLGEAHGEHLDPHESGHGDVDVEAEVRGLLVEHLAGVDPGDAGGLLGEDDADETEHRPAGVLELALAEADDVESLVEGLVRGEGKGETC